MVGTVQFRHGAYNRGPQASQLLFRLRVEHWRCWSVTAGPVQYHSRDSVTGARATETGEETVRLRLVAGP